MNEFTSSDGIISTIAEFGNSFRDGVCKLEANKNQGRRPCSIRMSVSNLVLFIFKKQRNIYKILILLDIY